MFDEDVEPILLFLQWWFAIVAGNGAKVTIAAEAAAGDIVVISVSLTYADVLFDPLYFGLPDLLNLRKSI